MRAGHAFFNSLKTAVDPIIAKRHALLRGPVGQQGEALTLKINQFYKQRGELKQERFLKPKGEKSENGPQIAAVEEQIKILKEERKALIPSRKKEIGELKKQYKNQLEELNRQVWKGKDSIVTKVRHASNLWHGNYARVTKEFTQAYKKALNALFVSQIRYRYGTRDNKPPQGGMLKYAAWDRAGHLTAELCNVGGPHNQTVKTVMDGTNQRFRLRPLNPKEYSTFGIATDFVVDPQKPPYIASVRTGSANPRQEKAWYEVVVLLHRPLSTNPNDLVKEVSIVREKVGFWHVTHLCVTMEIARKPSIGADTVTLTPEFERDSDNRLSYCAWRRNNGPLHIEYLPPRIEAGLAQTERLNRDIADHYGVAKAALIELNDGDKDNPVHRHMPRGLMFGTRRQLHYAYQAWSQMLKLRNGQEDPEAVQQVLRNCRKDCYELYQRTKAQGSILPYSGSYETAVAYIKSKLEDKFWLAPKQAETLAVILIFDERYVHLYAWEAHLREKIYNYRREVFRCLAVRLGANTKELVAFYKDHRTRRITDDQKLASPSLLKDVVKSYCTREGIAFRQVDPKDEAEAASHAKGVAAAL